MLVTFPNTAFRVFKRSGLAVFTKVASKKAVFNLGDLVAEGLSKKEAHLILRDLQHTEHVRRTFGGFTAAGITPTSITVNLRDARCDCLFKYAGTRMLLYLLSRGKSTAEIASATGLSARHLRNVKSALRELGVIIGDRVNPLLIKAPSDPLDLVPISSHREVLRVFREEVKGAPIVFYGEASWGIAAPTINLLIIHRGLLTPEEQKKLIVAAVKAAKKVSEYGVIIDLAFAAMEAWVKQKYGLIANPNPTLQSACEGIFIAGSEPTLEDYFEENMKATGLKTEDLFNMMKEGLIEATSSGRYKFTEKALRKLRRNPSMAVEYEMEILDKRVKLIDVKPP